MSTTAPGRLVRTQVRLRPIMWNKKGAVSARRVPVLSTVRPRANLLMSVADATYDYWRKP